MFPDFFLRIQQYLLRFLIVALLVVSMYQLVMQHDIIFKLPFRHTVDQADRFLIGTERPVGKQQCTLPR